LEDTILKSITRLIVSSVVVALLLSVSACQTDSGPEFIGFSDLDETSDLAVRVKRALKIAPQTAVNSILVTKVGDDTVKLSGYVLDDATKYEAERVAGQVEGVRHVFNSLTVTR